MAQNNPIEGASSLFRNVLILIIVVIVAAVVYKFYKAAKTAGGVIGDAGGGVIIQAQTGITPARQIICREVAQDCHSGIHTGWPYEDEPKVIAALNKLVSSKEGNLTSRFYTDLKGGYKLKADIIEYLNQSEINQIHPVIYQSL